MAQVIPAAKKRRCDLKARYKFGVACCVPGVNPVYSWLVNGRSGRLRQLGLLPFRGDWGIIHHALGTEAAGTLRMMRLDGAGASASALTLQKGVSTCNQDGWNGSPGWGSGGITLGNSPG